jgi:hypothetical protein
MPYLHWIEDKDLINAVQHLIDIAKVAERQSEDDFEKNVIDPFSALFQITGFNIDYDTWIISERTRQAQKSLQNHIGDFHQNILGSIEGWDNKKTGNIIDLVSDEKKIIAEVKNKHNTVKGSDLANLYKSLDDLVMHKSSIYKDYIAYYVTIIPRKPLRFNDPFTPSDKEKGAKCALNAKVRIIDGASFYSLVTGDQNALQNLYQTLPKIIQSCKGGALSEKGQTQLMKFFHLAFGLKHQ